MARVCHCQSRQRRSRMSRRLLLRLVLLASGHQVGCHVPSNIIPNKRYQFGNLLGRHELRYIHATRNLKFDQFYVSFLILYNNNLQCQIFVSSFLCRIMFLYDYSIVQFDQIIQFICKILFSSFIYRSLDLSSLVYARFVLYSILSLTILLFPPFKE